MSRSSRRTLVSHKLRPFNTGDAAVDRHLDEQLRDHTAQTFEKLRYLDKYTQDNELTGSEIDAGVTPVDFTVDPYHSDRYVKNTTPGTTDVTSGLQAGYNATPTGGTYTIGPGPYYITGSTQALLFNGQKSLFFQNTILYYNGTDRALRIGGDSGTKIFNQSVKGTYLKVYRASAGGTQLPIQDGTHTAASQLLGTGVLFTNMGRWMVSCPMYAIGFQYGYSFVGESSSLSLCRFSSLEGQNNLIDFFVTNANTGTEFVTSVELVHTMSTYNSAFYSSSVGTRIMETSKNGHTIDGFYVRGVFDCAQKENKLKHDGTWCVFDSVYWDASNGGTDIHLTANATHNSFRNGPSQHLMSVNDLGSLNTFEDTHYRQTKKDSTSGVFVDVCTVGTSEKQHKTLRRSRDFTDDDFDLIPIGRGWIDVTCGAEYGRWQILPTPTASRVAAICSANTSDTGADTNLTVFVTGGAIRVENRLGSTQRCIYTYTYDDT